MYLESSTGDFLAELGTSPPENLEVWRGKHFPALMNLVGRFRSTRL
jgi:hypothetical protein